MAHNAGGLTITFPPFDPNTDKLFQAIRSFIEIKHEDVERRLQRIETRQQKILTTLGTVEQLMTAAINAAAAAAATAATLNRMAASNSHGACVNLVEPVHAPAPPSLFVSSVFESAGVGAALKTSEAKKAAPMSLTSCAFKASLNNTTTANSVDLRMATSLADRLPLHPKVEMASRYSLTSPDNSPTGEFDYAEHGVRGPGIYSVLPAGLTAAVDPDRLPAEAHAAHLSHLSGHNLASSGSTVSSSQPNSLVEDSRASNLEMLTNGGGGSSLPNEKRSPPTTADIASLSPLQSSSIGTQMRVIFDRQDRRYIWLGGHQHVRLPLWAYVKCLETTRGMPDELGPRISLRMLQALFGKDYMLTHNYSGTNGKAPIDRNVLNAVLDQARLQFGTDHFYTDATCLSKFRDYINNAFRVVAYRDRKGVSVTCPFWDASGQPMTELFLLKSADLIRRLRLDQYDSLPPEWASDGPPAVKRPRSSSSSSLEATNGSNGGGGGGRSSLAVDGQPAVSSATTALDLYTAVSFPVTTIDTLSVGEQEESPISLVDSEEPAATEAGERKPPVAHNGHEDGAATGNNGAEPQQSR